MFAKFQQGREGPGASNGFTPCDSLVELTVYQQSAFERAVFCPFAKHIGTEFRTVVTSKG